MKRFYNRVRPECLKDGGGVPLPPKKQSGSHLARVSKSGTPPKANPKTGSDTQSASLEGLPVELQYEILQRLTCLPSLDAIIHASASYHKAYVARRQSILADVLSRDIGPCVLSEANAVAMALTINKKDGIEIRQFLRDYKTRHQEAAAVSFGRLSLPQIVALSQVQYAVRFAAEGFCQNTLSTHPLTSKKQEHILPLSSNEARRISRAFYRFELFCMICNQPSFKVSHKVSSLDMCHLFLNQFPPWEVEEIACVRDYIIGRYTQLFAKYEHELVRQRPEKDPQDSSGDEMPFLDVMVTKYAEHCMSHGLGFLHKISQASTFDQVLMLKKNLIDIHFFLTRAMGEEPYDYVYRTDAFDDWINKLPLRFVDDSSGPNAAWTWSNGDVVELFSFQPSKEDLREWGYVMWDKERLDRWGVLESSNEDYMRQYYD